MPIWWYPFFQVNSDSHRLFGIPFWLASLFGFLSLVVHSFVHCLRLAYMPLAHCLPSFDRGPLGHWKLLIYRIISCFNSETEFLYRYVKAIQSSWSNNFKGKDTFLISKSVNVNFNWVSQVIVYFMLSHASFPVYFHKINKSANDSCLCCRRGDEKHYIFKQSLHMHVIFTLFVIDR